MALGDKPAKQPEWNSGLTNQTEPTSGEKAVGFTVGGVAPSDVINWLLFTLYSWTRWVASYTHTTTGHVHDGGSNETGTSPSAPKVNFNAHINYGTNGSIQVTQDTVSEYTVTVAHGGGGDSFLAVDFLASGVTRSPTGLSVQNNAGTLTTLQAGELVAPNAPIAVGEVEGATATLNAGFGFTAVTRGSAGYYQMQGVTEGVGETVLASVTARGLTEFTATYFIDGSGKLIISTFDASGTQADANFSVVAYKL